MRKIVLLAMLMAVACGKGKGPKHRRDAAPAPVADASVPTSDAAVPPTPDAATPPAPDAAPVPPDAGPSPQPVRAFPGAEGFGANAIGGRGGQVIKVTNLNASGAGSLQAALNVNAPRIIVFGISGVINGNLEIPYGNVTIAGQTAPGGGITIRGRLTGEYSYSVGNIIIRHIRVRAPNDGSVPGNQHDAIQLSRNSKIILDHVSAAFGIDEVIDFYESKDATLQWSTIESSATTGHPEGQHNYGMINGPDGARNSVHHNLFAHHSRRSPALAIGPAEVRNNVVYNVKDGFVHHNTAAGGFNIIGNYYKGGPSANLLPWYFDGGLGPRYYLANNYIDDPASSCRGLVQNPWVECSYTLGAPASTRVSTEFSFAGVPVTTQSPTDAYNSVLDRAGAFPRDIVTSKVVLETRNRAGAWGASMPTDLMAGLTTIPAPVDTDGDGMPDIWEVVHGLNPVAKDHNQAMPSGYTAIEDYINERAAQLLP